MKNTPGLGKRGWEVEDVIENKPFVIVAASDRGSVRERNEDYFGVFDPETDELAEKRGVLIVVADGMGGHFSGAEASRAMVEAMGEIYYENNGEHALDELHRAFHEGNRRVFDMVGGGRKGLAGTTCTAAVLFPDQIYLAHAGDSRAYMISSGGIHQLTRDHSVVGDMVRKGMLSREQARSHPHRNVITRAVGLREDVEPDIHEDISFQTGDTMLICSDGLFSMLSDDVIESIVSGNPPRKACDELIKKANSAGGEDNITVVLARKI